MKFPEEFPAGCLASERDAFGGVTFSKVLSDEESQQNFQDLRPPQGMPSARSCLPGCEVPVCLACRCVLC